MISNYKSQSKQLGCLCKINSCNIAFSIPNINPSQKKRGYRSLRGCMVHKFKHMGPATVANTTTCCFVLLHQTVFLLAFHQHKCIPAKMLMQACVRVRARCCNKLVHTAGQHTHACSTRTAVGASTEQTSLKVVQA